MEQQLPSDPSEFITLPSAHDCETPAEESLRLVLLWSAGVHITVPRWRVHVCLSKNVFSSKCWVPVSSTSFLTVENTSKGIWNMPQRRQLEKEEKFRIFNVYTINLASNMLMLW